MSRRGGFAWVLAGVLLMSGCSHADDPPTSRPSLGLTSMPEGPPFNPLKKGVPARQVPAPLVGEPSLERVSAAAAAGPSRLDAETYALAVAHLFTDERPGYSGEEAVQHVAARTMSPELRKYLVLDLDGLHALGWRQRYRTDLEMWIRSSPHGDPLAPDRVDVEIFGHDATETIDSGGWSQMRYDVVWQEGEWRLLSTSGGAVALDAVPGRPANLTHAQRKSYLTGPGWRRIPPA